MFVSVIFVQQICPATELWAKLNNIITFATRASCEPELQRARIDKLRVLEVAY